MFNILRENQISQSILNEKKILLLESAAKANRTRVVLLAWKQNVFELKKDNYFERKRYEELVKSFRRVSLFL